MNGAGSAMPSESRAEEVIANVVVLHVVSLTLFIARMFTRGWPVRRYGWDDFFITLAMISALVNLGFIISTVVHGFGRHTATVLPKEAMEIWRMLVLSSFVWCCTVAFAKISIACQLLRIKTDAYWQILLYTMIVIQFLYLILSIVLAGLRCRPLSAAWDPTIPGPKCLSLATLQTCLYILASIAIISDIIFSLIPLIFIVNIHRPLREKLVLASLMGLGLLTATAAIVKIPMIRQFGQVGDPFWDSVAFTNWSTTEAQIGIIAACIPCLRAPFERILRGMGILTTLSVSESHLPHGHIGNELHVLSTIPAKAPHTNIERSVSEENILPHYHQDAVRDV